MIFSVSNPLKQDILQQQIVTVQRGLRSIAFLRIFPFLYRHTYRRLIKRLNKSIYALSLMSKGNYLHLQEILANKDWSEVSFFKEEITGFQEDLDKTISCQAKIDELNANNQLANPGSKIVVSSLEGTMESLFDLILLLKKINNRTTIETSDLAKYTAKKSANTLQKVIKID